MSPDAAARGAARRQRPPAVGMDCRQAFPAPREGARTTPSWRPAGQGTAPAGVYPLRAAPLPWGDPGGGTGVATRARSPPRPTMATRQVPRTKRAKHLADGVCGTRGGGRVERRCGTGGRGSGAPDGCRDGHAVGGRGRRPLRVRVVSLESGFRGCPRSGAPRPSPKWFVLRRKREGSPQTTCLPAAPWPSLLSVAGQVR